MTPAYIAKLGMWPRFTNIDAQKIDYLVLEIYDMNTASFCSKIVKEEFDSLGKLFCWLTSAW